jgi:hypothetical protein
LPSSIDELERAAVQLWEAKRLFAHRDVAHCRLALLLLDNAAETSLRRTARHSMLWADSYEHMAYALRAVEPHDSAGRKLKRDILARTVSKSKRRQIERNFAALVDYVVEQAPSALPSENAACLKILHRYRNAAYHQDAARADVLQPAVQIYFYLCCQLLRAEYAIWHEIARAPDTILALLGDTSRSTEWPDGFFDTQTLAELVSLRLLDDLELDHSSVANALADHLAARLTALSRHIETIGEIVGGGRLPWVDRTLTLRLVQLAPRTREEAEADVPADFWVRPLPVTPAVLESWVSAVDELRLAPDAYLALREFAEVEEPLESLEGPVGRFIEEFEREQQQRSDEARGK